METIDLPYRPMRSPMPAPGALTNPRSNMLPITLAVILVYLLLVPPQFNPTIADIYLSPFRIFLIGASLFVITSALRERLRFGFADLLIVLAIGWIWLASYMSSGSVATSIVMGGSHTVDIGLSYFLARSAIQTPDDLRRFLILIAPGVFIMSMLIIAESLTHTLIVQRLAGALTGLPYPTRWDTRLGLMRGMGSFPHPILAGICLGSLLPIYLLSGLRGWPRLLGTAATLGGFFTLSSAAMLSLIVGGLLVCYDWINDRIANLNWRVFIFLAAVLAAVVEFGSKSGFYSVLIRYASLNQSSAYNRVLIWEFGTQNVAANPWFGIGYSDWDRPEWMVSGSFDHFWLILALRFGIPEFALLFAATLAGIVMVAVRSRRMFPHDARLMRGVAISLGVFALGLMSVSLWMAPLAWFFMLLGVAVSLGSDGAARSVPNPSGPRAVYRRWQPTPGPGTGDA